MPAPASPVSFVPCIKDFTGRKVLENSSGEAFSEGQVEAATRTDGSWK